MTWFKVDDGFYDHPKVLELDNASIGLWTLAGSYCARHLTDGVITDRQIRAIGGTRRQAEKLVAAGLWSRDEAPASARRSRADASPSVRRYFFNDWSDFQPSRDEVTAKRNEDAERKRAARAAKRDKQRKCENVRSDVPADVQTDGVEGVRSDVRTSSALPGPTRPDPTYKEKGEKESGTVPDGHRPPPPPIDSLDALANAHAQTLLCDRHQGMDPADVPPCRACEAKRKAAHAREKRAATQARHNRRAQINACDLCDDNGWILIDGVATRCNHHHERKTA
ncbi:hypothetical protein [Corynebacterium flavescens]|uniref:hypothetical protein n=1 Tax=Corynebacterium flavescens TaxID=28028 RepID=UPI003FD24CC2